MDGGGGSGTLVGASGMPRGSLVGFGATVASAGVDVAGVASLALPADLIPAPNGGGDAVG